jgi:hypothetical protein
MAKHSVVRNPLSKGYAVLTPEVFRSIDLRARRYAGGVFEISTSDAMHDAWGLKNMMAGSVYMDVRKLSDASYGGPVCNDARILEICNQATSGTPGFQQHQPRTF